MKKKVLQSKGIMCPLCGRKTRVHDVRWPFAKVCCHICYEDYVEPAFSIGYGMFMVVMKKCG